MAETTHKAADECYIRIIPAGTGSPAGKLADAEIHWTPRASGVLAGMKIVGFAIWAPRSANAGRNVTFPARTYSVNGDRRSFALVRPMEGGAEIALADSVREAYQAHERAEQAAYQAEIDARRPITPSDFAVVAEVFGTRGPVADYTSDADARAKAQEDDDADRQRGAINHEADAAYQADQAARRQLSDRLATMSEDEARMEAGRLASMQPGGINLMDLAPGGKYGRTPAVRQTIADTQNDAARRFEF